MQLPSLTSDEYGHVIDRMDAICPDALHNMDDELQIEVMHVTRALLLELVQFI